MNIEDIVWPTEPNWHLGVSGTRLRLEEGVAYPTDAAVDMLRELVTVAVEHGAHHIHHGACTGWDTEAVEIARVLPGRRPLIYAHPPIKDTHLSQRALLRSHFVYPPKPYSDRNVDIAGQSAVLLIGAQYPEFHPLARRSGSWMTARYGRRFGDALYSVSMQGELSDVTRHVVAGTD